MRDQSVHPPHPHPCATFSYLKYLTAISASFVTIEKQLNTKVEEALYEGLK